MSDPQDPADPGSPADPQGPAGATPDVALVHWAFPPTVGGVETHLWDYSRLLAAQGHRVLVLTGTAHPDRPTGVPGVTVLRHPGLDLTAATGGPEERDDLRAWFRSTLTRHRIRVVHAHNLHHFNAAPAAALLELRAALRLVLLHTYHSVWHEPRGEAARAVERWDGHYAVSEFLVRDCAEVLGVSAGRTYLGIDTAPFLPLEPLPADPPQGPATVLLPARLIPDKGAQCAIKAFEAILGKRLCPDVDARLLLTDTPDSVDFHGEKIGFRDTVEKLIKTPLLAGRVAFTDEKAGVAQMPGLYRRARVVIYPSVFREPMGLAPLEAMCAARPVVVTRVGGLDEGLSRDSEVGYVVPPRDPEALADRIAALLNQPARARAMGLAGRRHVLRRFDMKDRYLAPMVAEYRARLADADAGRAGGRVGAEPASRTLGAQVPALR
ncbi:glycosyltransferase family 4 protein [Streptacidiphilus sp. EB129]|uniref:glycosyltransferase family 4 protein n=1 Tax=Streptacidiphilus sp. EB129 TaxID=3156262 RepID=UPI003511FDA3